MIVPVTGHLLRRLDARRLAVLLGVVGRVRSVAELAVDLVAVCHLEQRFDRPDRIVQAGMQVAELREAGGHLAIVKSRISTSGSSSQVTGADTGPHGKPRTL